MFAKEYICVTVHIYVSLKLMEVKTVVYWLCITNTRYILPGILVPSDSEILFANTLRNSRYYSSPNTKSIYIDID